MCVPGRSPVFRTGVVALLLDLVAALPQHWAVLGNATTLAEVVGSLLMAWLRVAEAGDEAVVSHFRVGWAPFGSVSPRTGVAPSSWETMVCAGLAAGRRHLWVVHFSPIGKRAPRSGRQIVTGRGTRLGLGYNGTSKHRATRGRTPQRNGVHRV